VTSLSGDDAQFVAGSQRGWGVQSSFVEKHPERYQILLDAIEKASKDPEAVANLQGQDLATEWFGPEASNKALASTAKVMAEHVDLLQGT
jgi:hypothetical protein